MNLSQQFQMLGRQQLAFDEGIQLLRRTKIELLQAKASATTWGNVAVIANAVLVPLNCIVNAFELKAATSTYQALVRAMYAHFSQSGTRSEGPVKSALSLLKQAVTAELKRGSLAEFVPGATILFGLAQDSLALWQSARSVSAGSKEMDALLAGLNSKIDAAVREMNHLGIWRAQVVDRMQAISRTA